MCWKFWSRSDGQIAKLKPPPAVTIHEPPSMPSPLALTCSLYLQGCFLAVTTLTTIFQGDNPILAMRDFA